MKTLQQRNATMPGTGSPRAISDGAAAIAGLLAAGVTGVGMLVLRSALQVRSMPERLMEWLLLFVPPDTFEDLLRRFGFDAKRYALDGAILAMLVVLAGLGYLVLRRGWAVPAIGGLGLGLWLFVMLVIMPLTSAGLFAMDLLDGKRAAIGGYLALGLTYASVLSIARYVAAKPSQARAVARVNGDVFTRRAAVGLVASASLAWIGTVLAVRLLPKRSTVATVILTDPQEPVPSGGLDAPNPHPNAVASPGPRNPAPDTAVQAGQGALPEPAGVRPLARDQDGAVLPSGRPAGSLASAITRTDDFYIVTKNAAGDPTIHPGEWRLLVDGEVQRSFELDYATLRRLPAIEFTKTLECISNMVGKPELAPFGAELISTATWKGARTADILGIGGGPTPGAAWVAVLSADEYTSALPIQVLVDPATVLVYEMNGQVLPREHGYPARLLVPDRYGMKNPKWVVGLRPMRREFVDWYGQRQWSKTGLVRTMTRIDEPALGAVLPAGSVRVAGVAYAGNRGIQRVEVSADSGGTWTTAELLDPPAEGEDRWVRWQSEFDLPAKQSATVIARSTDGTGALQMEAFSLPQPDGGTGWPTVQVRSE